MESVGAAPPVRSFTAARPPAPNAVTPPCSPPLRAGAAGARPAGRSPARGAAAEVADQDDPCFLPPSRPAARSPSAAAVPVAADSRPPDAGALPLRRSPRVAAAARAAAAPASVALPAAAALASPPALVVWFGPDGPETAPPPGALADPGPARCPLAVTSLPCPLPPAAAAWRAGHLALVDAVDALAVSLPSAGLWLPRRGATMPPLPAPSAGAHPVRGPARAPLNGPACGHFLVAQHAPLPWRRLLTADTAATQPDQSLAADEERRAGVFSDLPGWGRTGLAVVQGGRAALWLTAVPSACGGRGTIPGSAMRVAARLWLGARPRPEPPRARCSCGAATDAGGRHFLSFCPAQVGWRTAVHDHIVSLVAAALRRAPRWGTAVVEAPLDGSGGARRPDLRATDATTAAFTWADVSVAWPWPDAVASQVRATPLRALAAAACEARKRATHVPALPVTDPPHAFAPIVWEALGRIGPVTDAWVAAALAGPRLAAVRAGLLLDASVALWRSLAWAVARGYAACCTPAVVEERTADVHTSSAQEFSW